jgi:hypothetical protein
MNALKKIAVFLWINCLCLTAGINPFVKQDYEDGDFKLVYGKKSACIVYDSDDYKVVEIVVNDLARDIQAVTGSLPSV